MEVFHDRFVGSNLEIFETEIGFELLEALLDAPSLPVQGDKTAVYPVFFSWNGHAGILLVHFPFLFPGRFSRFPDHVFIDVLQGCRSDQNHRVLRSVDMVNDDIYRYSHSFLYPAFQEDALENPYPPIPDMQRIRFRQAVRDLGFAVVSIDECLGLADPYEEMPSAYPEYPLAGIGSFESGIQDHEPGFRHGEGFRHEFSPGIVHE